jgi:hypothetical protein
MLVPDLNFLSFSLSHCVLGQFLQDLAANCGLQEEKPLSYLSLRMAQSPITPELALAALSPSTAFRSETTRTEKMSKHDSQTVSLWTQSFLNPKNRIDSLSPSQHPTWRIDGCTRLGTQFYTIPTFFSPVSPLHIHTFIPEPSQWPLGLRSLLEIDSAFLYWDSRINNFRVAQHVLRTLDNWSSTISDFHSMYGALPFGSRIVFENMEKDITQIRIQILRTHDLERQMWSITFLPSRFTKYPSVILPPTLDISRLHLVQQIHDSTAIVELDKFGTKSHLSTEVEKETLIFKTLSDSPSYLYHELSILLTMPPHPNIIAAPVHLVTRKVRFGSKLAVVGFTLPYLPKGSLRDILPRRRIQGTLHLDDQIKWALQITQALNHIQDKGPGWYCDLRLDNVLLSDSDDVVLIDFEQRGVMPSFAAPEIRYLDYIITLVKESSLDGELKEYKALYEQHIGPLVEGQITDEYHGSTSWLCQIRSKREALQVYMLGRLLWCIFEGVSAPQVEIWMEYLHEPDIEFPVFERTPMRLRPLVERCTQGWTQDINTVKRRGSWLVAIADEKEHAVGVEFSEFTKIWADELERAKAFLRQKKESHLSNVAGLGHLDRPSLAEVLEILANFQKLCN